MMRRLPAELWRWTPLVAWIALVLYASTGVGSADASHRALHPLFALLFPGMSLAAAEALNVVVRKGAHVVQFLCFALLVWRAVRFVPAWRWGRGALLVWIFVLSLGLSLASEGVQLFFAERGASIADLGWNMLGTLLGLLVVRRFDKPAWAGGGS